MRALGLALLVVLVPVGAALADDVPPPPKDCVPGSRETTGHSGPYCAPATCSASAPYKDASCETRKLCIVMKTLDGGRRPRQPPPVVPTVVAACDRKPCAQGVCKALKVCVPRASKSEAEPPARRAGCGCSLGDASPRDALLGALVALALVLRGARARRRS